MEVASSRKDHQPTMSTAKTSEFCLLVDRIFVTDRPMPARLLRHLFQCAGDIEMDPGPVSKPTNCLRLMQWNANGISGETSELLTFLLSNNVNVAAIQETNVINKTKPLKTPGWSAMRHDRLKIKGGGLIMLVKDTIPFVDNTAVLPQSADPHREQQCIWTTMPNRQQLHIHNIDTPPRSSCSAGHNASKAHLLSNNKMSFIVVDINAIHSRLDTNKNEEERDEQLADEIVTADYTILSENEATRLPFAIICPSSSPSTPKCPRLIDLGEPTSTKRKRTGHVILKHATNT